MSQLILHERIETTVPRAKELRKVADRMVTLGKEVWSSNADHTAAPDKLLSSNHMTAEVPCKRPACVYCCEEATP